MADRSQFSRRVRRIFLYPLQGALIYVLFWFCRTLPLTWASAFGSRLLRSIGPFLKGDRVARRNLARAFPEMTQSQIDETMRGIWDNLGRGAGEWAQVDRIQTIGPDSRVEVVNERYFSDAVQAGGPFIIFSGHFGNWEMASVAPAQRGTPLVNVYRHASIPMVNTLFEKVRGSFCKELIPKGRAGARRIVAALKAGDPVGMMLDQRLNEGISIPYFGRDAKTATAPAELAMKFKCPLIPVRIERLPGVRFRLTVFEPLTVPDSGDKKADIRAVMVQVNALFEDWARDKPEQWLWVHNRWGDK